MDKSDAGPGSGAGGGGITRGELLKAAAVAAPGLLLGRTAAASARRNRGRRAARAYPRARGHECPALPDRPAAVHPAFPARLGPGQPAGPDPPAGARHLFEHAFTNACMCSPARSTLMSGYFPAQHGVKYTLELDMPAPQYPQVELSTSFKNLASVSRAAGYTPVYKGKFPATSPRTARTGSRGRQQVRLHPVEPAGRGRRPEHPRGGGRPLRQRRPVHELGGHGRSGDRGRRPVPA